MGRRTQKSDQLDFIALLWMVRYSPSPKYLEIPTLLAKPCPPWWPPKQWSVLQQLKRGTSESPGTSTLRKAAGDMFVDLTHFIEVSWQKLNWIRARWNFASITQDYVDIIFLKKNILDTAKPCGSFYVPVSSPTHFLGFPALLAMRPRKKDKGANTRPIKMPVTNWSLQAYQRAYWRILVLVVLVAKKKQQSPEKSSCLTTFRIFIIRICHNDPHHKYFGILVIHTLGQPASQG